MRGVAENFITNSIQVQNIIKGLTLTKSLFVSSILIGEPHSGKKTLIHQLFPTAIYADGANPAQLEQLLEIYEELIIINFEKLHNIEKLHFKNKRIIAIADHITNEKIIDSLFAFIYQMPPLKERKEDIDLLAAHLLGEIKTNLALQKDLAIDTDKLDISKNMLSLRRSVYYQVFAQSLDETQIEEMLYNFFLERLKGKNDYKNYLFLYEKPLIEAGLKKFGSQLKLADILGINRNTLRKKIYELGID